MFVRSALIFTQLHKQAQQPCKQANIRADFLYVLVLDRLLVRS